MSFAAKQFKLDDPRLVPSETKPYREFVQDAIADAKKGSTFFGGGCEMLQRMAHGRPATFPSALAHQLATPKKERLDPREAPNTSFVFIDDPADSNLFGHVVGKWGDAKTVAEIQVATNDVATDESGYDYGNVTICPLGWFKPNWGDSVQFATTWFAGAPLVYAEVPKPGSGRDAIARFVKAAVHNAEVTLEDMRRAKQANENKAHPKLEAALARDIEQQQRTIRELKSMLP